MGRYVVSADLHLRSSVPTCRKETPEEWENRQISLLKRLQNIANENNAILMIVGDIFDTNVVPPWIVNMFLDQIPSGIILTGNHDYKYRNTSEILNSSIGHIIKNPSYTIVDAEDSEIVFINKEKTIAMTHQLVFHPKDAGLAKFGSGLSAIDVIKKAKEISPDVQYVFCGDNHHKFKVIHDNVMLVNPGSPLRINAGQKDDVCGVYIVDTDKSSIKFIEIEDDADLVTDEYLRKEEKRVKGISTFIERVASASKSDDNSMDFWDKAGNKVKLLNKAFKDEHNEIKQICEGVISE